MWPNISWSLLWCLNLRPRREHQHGWNPLAVLCACQLLTWWVGGSTRINKPQELRFFEKTQEIIKKHLEKGKLIICSKIILKNDQLFQDQFEICFLQTHWCLKILLMPKILLHLGCIKPCEHWDWLPIGSPNFSCRLLALFGRQLYCLHFIVTCSSSKSWSSSDPVLQREHGVRKPFLRPNMATVNPERSSSLTVKQLE